MINRIRFFLLIALMVMAAVTSTNGQTAIREFVGVLEPENAGMKDMTFELYRNSEGGTAIWTEKLPRIKVNKAGVYRVLLGKKESLVMTRNGKSYPINFGESLWLEVSIDGECVDILREELPPLTADYLQGYNWSDVRAVTPVGTVFAYAGDCSNDKVQARLEEQGYLVCRGQTVSRIKYQQLFAAIGTIYGNDGDESTFDLPDYRGQFLRGVDDGRGLDPDAPKRTAMTKGAFKGDKVGSVQGDSVKAGSFKVVGVGNHSHTCGDAGNHNHGTNTAGAHTHNYNDPLKGDWKGMSYDGNGTTAEYSHEGGDQFEWGAILMKLRTVETINTAYQKLEPIHTT